MLLSHPQVRHYGHLTPVRHMATPEKEMVTHYFQVHSSHWSLVFVFLILWGSIIIGLQTKASSLPSKSSELAIRFLIFPSPLHP